MNDILGNNRILSQFKILYEECAPMLVFFASKYVDRIIAEDLVQDVYLRIWQKKSFLFLNDSVKSYLYRSVQHACLDYLKHEDVKHDYIKSSINRLKIEEIYYNNDPSFLFCKDDRIECVYKEIDKLPQKCREIFMLSYLEEKKSSEIAASLNISIRTVEAQLYKALKILRSLFLFLLLILPKLL